MRSESIFNSKSLLLLIGMIALAFVWGVRLVEARTAAPANARPTLLATPPPVPAFYPPVSLSPGANVLESSPTLADLNGDGKLDIIVGTSNGFVFALNGATGAKLWSRDVRPYGFISGLYPSCGTDVPIRSTPAVGRLRAPGSPNTVLGVVVGVGSLFSTNGNGGVIAFDKDGNWLWTRLTKNKNGDNCSDGVVSSPTVADLNHDGHNKVIFGAFDKRVYVLNDDGTDVAPWPLKTSDTQWSSPAVGDIDGDGNMEIVLASDVGRLNQNCPYLLEWPQDYCGGSISVRRLDGTELTGFPYQTWQAIQSPPVLADLNNDGKLDIIVGSGTYYNTYNLTPNDSFLLYAIDYTGHDLPGWPVDLNGVTDGEPAIADLNGDGNLEVVMGTGDSYCFQGANYNPPYQNICPPNHIPSPNYGYLYAIHHDGMNHPGGPFLWTKQPLNSVTNSPAPIRAPMIADYNNDGTLDVIYSIAWEIQAVNGLNGAAEIGGPGAPASMLTNYSILGAPAIGDLNGDGKLEIVAASAVSPNDLTGMLYVWAPASGSSGRPAQPWPMYRQNPAHMAHYALPNMQGGPTSIFVLHAPGRGPYKYVYPITNTGDDEPMRMTVSATNPNVSVQPSSTMTIMPDETKMMTVTVTLGSSFNTPGTYALGTVTMSAVYGAGSGRPAINSPRTAPVTVLVVPQLYDAFLPAVAR